MLAKGSSYFDYSVNCTKEETSTVSLVYSIQPWPTLNTLVPHAGHTPRVADLPFFSVTFWGFFISLLARHLKQ